MSHKKIGSTIYVHKSNIQELLDIIDNKDHEYLDKVISCVTDLNELDEIGIMTYEVIKYDIKQHRLSFIESSDWRRAKEPTVGESVCFNLQNGNHSRRKGGNAVYHSKELFVSDHYAGFDIQKAKERTKLWQSLVTKEEKKLIGNKKYWTEFCTRHGIGL